MKPTGNIWENRFIHGLRICMFLYLLCIDVSMYQCMYKYMHVCVLIYIHVLVGSMCIHAYLHPPRFPFHKELIMALVPGTTENDNGPIVLQKIRCYIKQLMLVVNHWIHHPQCSVSCVSPQLLSLTSWAPAEPVGITSCAGGSPIPRKCSIQDVCAPRKGGRRVYLTATLLD